MKKHSNAESAIRTHQLESVPCVVIRLEIVPLISTPKTVPNGVPTPPLNSVPPITEAEIASISRPLACSTNPEQLFEAEEESAASCKQSVQNDNKDQYCDDNSRIYVCRDEFSTTAV